MVSNSLRMRIVVFVVLLAVLVSVEARARSGGRSGGSSSGGRSGGGSSGGRSGGSSGGTRTTRNGHYSSYSSSSVVGGYSSTWRTTPQGASAYLILSRLATPGRPYRTQYVNIENGDVCENYEDFNGTMLGEFQCPLDGFQSGDLYCCGEDGYEYCCNESGSVNALVYIVPLCVIIVMVLVGVCVYCKLRKKDVKNNQVLQQHGLQQPPPPRPPPPQPSHKHNHKHRRKHPPSNRAFVSHQNAIYPGDYEMTPPPPPPPAYSNSHSGHSMSVPGPPQYTPDPAYTPQHRTTSRSGHPAVSPPPYKFAESSKLSAIEP